MLVAKKYHLQATTRFKTKTQSRRESFSVEFSAIKKEKKYQNVQSNYIPSKAVSSSLSVLEGWGSFGFSMLLKRSKHKNNIASFENVIGRRPTK